MPARGMRWRCCGNLASRYGNAGEDYKADMFNGVAALFEATDESHSSF